MTAHKSAMPSLNEMKALLFKSVRPSFSKCYAPPGAECKAKAIRAHSIQNAKVLDLLEENGHVSAMVRKLDWEEGRQFAFSLEGRNEASTFLGLCGKHDAFIFKPIDTAEIDVDNPEHLFLVAYRTAIYGAHSTSATAKQLQEYFLKVLELGVPHDASFKQLERTAAEFLIAAMATFNYKVRFDQTYIERTFADVTHDVINLNVAQPTLACSTLFHLALEGGRVPTIVGVGLSIFPLSQTRTVAVLSYLKKDVGEARAAHSRVLESVGDHQKYELSRLVLNRCENFVLAPRFVSSWSDQKRGVVTNLAASTLFEPDFEREDPNLLLFA